MEATKQRTNLHTHAHDDVDRRDKVCKCFDCGITEVCTPAFDFYGKDGEPLRCERCMMKHHGLGDKKLMHMVPVGDGKAVEVTKEQFVGFVEAHEALAEKKNWYFTFGCGQPHEHCYTVIHGTFEEARVEMNRRYNRVWCGQYESAEEAGVEKWHLEEIK